MVALMALTRSLMERRPMPGTADVGTRWHRRETGRRLVMGLVQEPRCGRW